MQAREGPVNTFFGAMQHVIASLGNRSIHRDSVMNKMQ